MKKPTQKSTQKTSFGLQPLSDRIIVQEQKIDNAKKTQSGIYLPEHGKEDRGAKKGIVVAVGPGRFEDGKLVPMQVQAGDIVLFQWGEQVTFQGEEYFIVRESEVAAIVS